MGRCGDEGLGVCGSRPQCAVESEDDVVDGVHCDWGERGTFERVDCEHVRRHLRGEVVGFDGHRRARSGHGNATSTNTHADLLHAFEGR